MRRILFLAMALAWVNVAHANHDTPATILGYWDRVASSLHILPPAKTVRPLPESTDRQAVEKIAASAKGVCAILFGSDPVSLRGDLERQFPRARLIEGDESFSQITADVIAFVENQPD